MDVARELVHLVRVACKDKDRPDLHGIHIRPGKDGDQYSVTDGRRALTVIARPGHPKASETFNEIVVGAADFKAGLTHVATDKEERAEHPTVELSVDEDTVVIVNKGGEGREVIVHGEVLAREFVNVSEAIPKFAAKLDANGINPDGAEAYGIQVNPAQLAILLKAMGQLSEASVMLLVPKKPGPLKVVGRFGAHGEMIGVLAAATPESAEG